ncbi:MAG TPA: DUF6159 family protein [Gemmataceae bacterium]|nr:DUF6159 family protein [Gemmataceae bacterium]
MFERISNGFELARSSWQVLRREKQLIVFPILSGLGCLLVLISFAVPMVAFAPWDNWWDKQGNWDAPPWVYAVAFAFYFCNYFVIVFCNAALISCSLMSFNGQAPTINDGIQAAMSRLPQIFAWALVSATVGVVLKIIENAHEKAGYFISAILGTAWTIMTYFVVPVLVVEKVGPFQAIGRSVQILKKTWGESLVGHMRIGFFMFLLCLPGILVCVLGFLMLATNALMGAFILGLGLIYVVGCTVVSSALDVIFLSAVYQFAANQQVPAGFDAHVLERAFEPKK